MRSERRATNSVRSLVAAGAVLLVGLAIAGSLSWRQARNNHARASERFQMQANNAAEKLLVRIQSYEYGLRGARVGVIAVGDDGLTRTGFRTLSESREVDGEFPGARGFGFIRRVPRSREAAFVEAARRDGWPEFSIHGFAPHSGERYVIQYVEPIERNAQAVGLDIASETSRRTAALQAARSGQPTLTGPITLVQAPGQLQHSFLVLLPVYRPGWTLTSAEEREAAAWGWTYAPLIIDEVLASFDYGANELALALDDVTDASAPQRFFDRSSGDLSDRTLTTVLTREVFGRTWRIEARALPPFYAGLNYRSPVAIFVALSLIAALLAALVFAYASARARKLEVHAEQARLANIVENTTDAVIGKTLAGVVTDWNRSAEQMFGYSAQQAIGKTLSSLIVPDEYQEEEREILQRIGRGEAVPHFYTRRKRADGALLDVAIAVSPIRDAGGKIVGAAKTARDVTQLRAAESALRQVQERLTIAAQANGIGVWEWNALTRELTFDDTLYELYGRRREDFASAHELWRASLHPDDVTFSDETFKAAIEGRKSLDTSFRIVTPDGQIRHIRTRATVFRDAAGRVMRVLGTNYDCTAETEREQRLDELNATLEQQVAARTSEINELWALQRAILADAAYAVIATDLDGTIRHFNPAAERMLGYRADELVGKVTPSVIHDPAEVAQRAQVLNAELGLRLEPGFEVFVAKAKLQRTDANEWTYVRKDGSRLPVLLSVSALRRDDGEIFGYLGMVVDLTERRQAEQALRSSERFLAAITDHIPATVAYWDADLRLRFANEVFRKSHGRSAEQLRGIGLLELVGESGYQFVLPYACQVLRGEAQSFELKRINSEGSTSYSLVSMVPDIDGKEVKGFYAMSSDVTELKQAQIALESANETLEIRTREAEAANAAKSAFLANMSHEIRTPLNAVIGLAYLLEDSTLDRQQRDSIAKIQVASRSLLSVINDVLDISKIEADEMEIEQGPFDSWELLLELRELVAQPAETKGLQLIIPTQPTGVPRRLVGDVTRFRQILTNLLSNAIKFTARGHVELTIECLERSGDKAKLRCTVRDTGIGVEPQTLQKLFTPFTQADASTTRHFGGTGLGLSIVRRLAELMGGSVGVNSAVGVGSGFWVELPFGVVADSALLAPASARTSAENLSGIRVLLVDDSELNLEVGSRILERAGALVQLCKNGREACERLRAGPSDIDIVLMDVQMPEMDGNTAAHIIRSELGLTALPILALTAGALVTERQRSLDAGMNDFLTKPLKASTLIRAIHGHVQRSKSTADLPVHSGDSHRKPPIGWPEFEGISAVEVCERLTGDEALFRRLLDIFVRDYEQFALTALPNLGDTDARHALAARAHKLRGGAGILAATSIESLATEAETLLTNEPLHARTPIVLQEMQSQLHALIERIKAEKAANSAKSSKSSKTVPMNGKPIDALEISELEGLLRSHDLAAIDLFQAMALRLQSRIPNASFGQIRTALNELRFKEAADLLSEFRRSA